MSDKLKEHLLTCLEEFRPFVEASAMFYYKNFPKEKRNSAYGGDRKARWDLAAKIDEWNERCNQACTIYLHTTGIDLYPFINQPKTREFD